jgi:hypothetical protein
VYIVVISLLLLVFFALLSLGLLSVLRELVERYCQCEPVFGDQGPIFNDQDFDQPPAGPQLAMPSRASYSRRPD